jgi:pimeloyl-ACP methyl ester carboxylesterase
MRTSLGVIGWLYMLPFWIRDSSYYPGGGHAFHREDPAEFAAGLADFAHEILMSARARS